MVSFGLSVKEKKGLIHVLAAPVGAAILRFAPSPDGAWSQDHAGRRRPRDLPNRKLTMAKTPTPLRTLQAAFLVVLVLAPSRAGAAEEELRTSFGPEGPTSISYNGTELLVAKSPPAADAAIPSGTTIRFAQAPACTFKDGVWTQTWDGLEVMTRLRQDKDVLSMDVALRNTGSQPLAKVNYEPFRLHFPRRPQGGRWYWGYEVSVDAEESPGVVVADWGRDKLALCVERGSPTPTAEDASRPMTIGFKGNYGPYDSAVRTPVFFRANFAPPLDPGKRWTFSASVRLASSATPMDKVAGDIYAGFAKAVPFALNWPDRRPIGAIFMARDNTKWKTNPRGWFNDEKVDVVSEEGRKAFRERLLKFADGCVAEVRKTGGQGVIVWDIEGDQMPHAITYLGDPRVLPQEAPEMDAVADEFFKTFRDADLKTGICIRPSRVIPDGHGGWKHQQVDDPVGDMADKIAYAKRRWGCTIFYMDTNVLWPLHRAEDDPSRGMWQGDARLLTTAEIRALCRRHPDVLIFPEFGHIGYRSVCGVYGEFSGENDSDKENGPRTSDEIRLVYPQACTVVNCKGDYLSYYRGLLKGALRGDIHLFRGWFADTTNAQMRHLYEEADFLRHAPSVHKTGPLEDLLADPDPSVRFTAVARLNKPDSSQVAALVRALGSEKEWAVRRQIVEALGASGDASAVPALAALVKDPGGLGRFASLALGRIGAAATPTLLGLAAEKERRWVEMALRALAQYGDPAATATVLSLTESPEASIRGLAARALGSRPSPEGTARLIALLEDKQDQVVGAACASLGRLRDRTAIKALVDLHGRTKNNSVHEAAGRALEAITGLEYGPYAARWKKALDEGTLEVQRN